MNYVPIIGMEVHIELKTKSKMFCACPNDPDLKQPNINICEVCLGHPGTLPVPNKKALAWTVLIGRALGCSIRRLSKFDRKHYFYPDLPKGYQISQYDEPIAERGKIGLSFVLEDNIRETANIGIGRVHLEEDTAKLIHDTSDDTLVDFNRAGVPLVEIVTNPDFKTALEAKIYCQELQRIMRYLGVSDADMEKGHMRCEANVSMQEAGRFEIVGGEVKPLGDYKLNHKVELKNINSFRAVEKAIQYEIDRQIELGKRGEPWPQQTRGWDEDKGETVLQRVKENAEDYRYFPEPDIPPFHPLKIAWEVPLPELPIAKRQRFHEEYGFSYADAKILTETKDWADFAEAVMSELSDWLSSLAEAKTDNEKTARREKSQGLARLAGGWLTSKLMGAMSERALDIKILKLSSENFAELVALVAENRVNSTNAQKILAAMLDSGVDLDPTHVMEEKGYGQISDEKKLNKIIEEVIKNYPKPAADFRAGKEPILKFLIGMVMKATEGSADPQAAEKLLREKLKIGN
ncbi:MAG: glutaminyl-tRNA synthase (glutamine-hydrolyzing) subunit B [Omnitrophica bacterium RIFCSPLOWO2_01_FULL_50_24]|nr:MAG: glutaminyl-tRNA synthase (glutamine-hydrolyzing) subunit B [Omnitrophica bacterium RIFCSPLOWO2_01_FULL_50_24]